MGSVTISAQETACGDGIDNDGDGLIDCYDGDCQGVAGCEDFFFNPPEPDCGFTPPELDEVELNLLYKTDESRYPIDQRAGVVVGDLDGDGIAELVSRDNGPPRIQIFDGATGELKQSIVTPATHPFGQLSIADVDGDGVGDIFQVEKTGRLTRYEFGNPDAIWRTANGIGDDTDVSTPQLADINQDGIPEVYIGDRIFNALTGERLLDGGSSVNVGGYAGGGNADRFPIYYDLFQPGDPKPDGSGFFGDEALGMEYIAGNEVWTTNNPANGTFQFNLAAQYLGPTNERDGFTSIADINGDGRMDIAVMDAGRVYAWDPYTNERIGPAYDVPGTGSGGRINIGDFDGDGDVELGFAGRNIYIVRNYIDNDGDADPNNGTWETLWQKTGLDDGSQRTGSTLFDFDGNGQVEVVYSEEENLFIYDGATGDILFQTTSRSGTRTEYPIVADVNGDGTAEIIVTAQELNGPQFSGTGWISVYESANQPWVPARNVWNQHGYNVTNINDDLTIPQFQQNNLNPTLGQRYNNFLVQTAVGGGPEGMVTYPAPDAVIMAEPDINGDPTIDFSDCPNTITINLQVDNIGSAPLPASTPISFYDGDPSTTSPNLIVATVLGEQVDTGQTRIVPVTIDVSQVPAGSPIWLSVNDPGFAPADLPFTEDDFPLTGTAECDYSNNVSNVGNVRCGEVCDNGIDDDGDGIVDEPNLVQTQSTGCPGDVLNAITNDSPGGTYSVLGTNDIGTTVDQNGVVTLGNNFSGIPITQTIRYDDGICTEEVMVTTVDDVAPQIICPGAQTLAVDANCEAFVPDLTGQAQASDNCTAVGDINFDQFPIPGDALVLGANTITLTAFDRSANTANCTVTVTVVDQIVPTITCPVDADVVVDANCQYTIPDLTGGATVDDNCSDVANISLAQTPVQGQVRSNDGTAVLVTLTATDEAGNVANCTYTLTLQDETPPTITCPTVADQTLSNQSENCTFNLFDYRGQVQRSDNCSAFNQITLTQSPAPGTAITSPGTVTVTITATDAAGNSTTCTFDQEVLDRDPPQLVCGQFAPIDPNPGTCDYTVPDVIAATTITDNCGVANLLTVTQSPAAGTTFTGFFQNVTVTATDASGNSNICVTTLLPGPPPPPTIVCPATQSLTADGDCAVPLLDYTGLATTDGCGTITVTQNPGAGTQISGTTTVTLTARNSVGVSATCTFEVEVIDNTPPTILCPATQTIAVDGTCEVPLPDYTGQASAADNCDPAKGPVSVVQSPPANGMYDINDSPVTVTLTATDASGNTANCSFQVELMDNQPPQISCPVSPQINVLDGSCQTTIPDFTTQTMVSSTCTMSGFTLVQSPAPGTVVTGVGITPITITATDASNNSVMCTFDFEAVDQTPPTITCPVDQTESVDGSCDFTIPDYTGMATTLDNCSPAPATAPDAISLSQSPAAGTVVSGNGTVTTITITATDASGNASSCDFDLTLEDTTAPVITCPADQTRELDGACAYELEDLTGLASAADNCTDPAVIELTQSPSAQTLSQPGTITVTLTAEDESGNTDDCTFTVTVVDATPPTITCPSDPTINLDDACMATVPDFTTAATISDNCASQAAPTVTQDIVPGTAISGEGTTQAVVLTVTDANGLTASCTVTITLDDVTPPAISCPTATNLNLDAVGCQVALPDYSGQLTLGDNCAAPAGNAALSVQQMPAVGTIISGANMVQVVTFSVSDGNGNSATCQFNVTTRDVTNPAVSCPTPGPLALDANCSVALPDFTGQATTNDDCAMTAGIGLTQSPAAGTTLTFDGAQTMVTITADDGNGNTAACTFTVTAEDTEMPAIACPADRTEAVSANCDFELPDYTGEAAVMDNCSEAAAITVTQSPAVGTIIPEGQLNVAQTITLTATDAAGNVQTCTFAITPVDEADPTIVCPAEQTILLGAASCEAVLGDYTGLATPLDNCTDAVAITITQDIPAGTTYTGLVPPAIDVVLTAEDESGNTAECAFEVQIVDNIDPTVDCSAANQTIALDENCNGVLPDLIPSLVTDDNCSADALTILQSPAAGAEYSGDGTTVDVTFTVTDASGNTVTCMAVVTFEDQSPPDPVVCPADQVLDVNSNCPVPLPDYRGAATVIDNCRAQSDIVLTQAPAPGTMVMGDGTVVTVTITADDGNGNTADCTFDVTLEDNTGVQLTCPGGQLVIASSDNCDAPLPDYTGDVVTSDDCMVFPAGGTISQSPAPGTLLTLADLDIPQMVTITVNDGNGNITSCQITATLVDTLAPVVTCPADLTDAFDEACGFVIEDYTELATITDNCTDRADLTITQDPPAGSSIAGPDAVQTITITATDPSGNQAQCSFDLVVSDTLAPVVTCPAPDTLLASADCEITIGDYTTAAITDDNCTAKDDLVVVQTPPPGTVISGHLTTQTITITATDGSGNSASCDFTVTAKDETQPEVLCPGDQIVRPDANCDALLPDYRAQTRATDNCAAAGAITLTQRPAPGTVLTGEGDAEQVTIVADDGNGNRDSCTFIVTLEDNVPPTIDCPADKTVEVDANCEYDLEDLTTQATVLDNCTATASILVTQNVGIGQTFTDEGTVIPVTLTADDGNGNTAQCVTTITLDDAIAPMITCPADQTIFVDAGCNADVPDYRSAVVSDNCAVATDIAVSQVLAPGTTLNGHNTVETITLTADDGNGNTTDCSFTLTLLDNTAPAITCPANQVVFVDGDCEAVLPDYTGQATASDNCTLAPAIAQNSPAGTALSGLSTETVTLTADDGNGNTTDCTFTVTVSDNTPPELTCPPLSVIAADPNCVVTLADYRDSIMVADNCGPTSAQMGALTLVQSPEAGAMIDGLGAEQVVTITATDPSGNSAECMITVELADTTKPTIVCLNDTTLAVDATCGAQIPDYTTLPEVADNCEDTGALTVTQSPVAGTMVADEASLITVTLTVTDASGNAVSCDFDVQLIDTIPPMITCPADVTETVDANCEISLQDYRPQASATDNCSATAEITFEQRPAPGTTFMDDGTVIPVTIVAVDQSGNRDSCVFNVTLDDAIDPVILACPNDSIVFVDASCEFDLPDFWSGATVTATDNCTPTGTVSTTATGDQIVYTQTPGVGMTFSGGTTTQLITLTADDGNGNTADCSFTLSLSDTISPVITVCPNDTVANPNADCEFALEDYTSRAQATDNCVADGAVTFTQSPAPGTVIGDQGAVQEITITAADANGNTTTCSFELSLQDTISPMITCPVDQVELVDASCMIVLPDYTNLATVMDNCTDAANITVTQLAAPGTTYTGVQTETVTLTADDGNGNTTSCTFEVNIEDEIDPVLTCPTTSIIPADAACEVSIVDYRDSVSVTDNCDAAAMIMLTQDVAVGTTINGLGATLDVTITATDQSGRTDMCVINVQLIDTIRPMLVCARDTMLGVDANCAAVLPDYRPVASATDNCNDPADITFIQMPPAGTPLNTEGTVQMVTITATDASGNSISCDFEVTLIDTIAPVVICPADDVISVDGGCEIMLADYTTNAQPTDNCSDPADITLSQSPAPGTLLSGDGTTQTVTITATDESGNSSTCTLLVTLEDSTDPMITCPADQELTADDDCEVPIPDYTGDAITSSMCDQGNGITVTQMPAPGTLISGHNTSQTITLTATDASGNDVSCDFEVTLVDRTMPEIVDCPVDTLGDVNANCEFTVPDYWAVKTVTATDNCRPSGTTATTATGDQIVYTQDPTPGTVLSSGMATQIITLTADDGNGNTVSCQFELTLRDTIRPVITVCPSDTTANPDTNCEFVLEDYTNRAEATDNCEQDGAIVFTQSPAAGTTISGDETVQEITITATDANGNTITCAFDLMLADTTSPMITCPAAQMELLDADCNNDIEDYTALALTDDNCDAANVTVSQVPAPGTIFNGVQTQTITLTADDGNGNTTNCTFELSIEDDIDPELTCPATSIIPADADCEVDIVSYLDSVSVTDNCDLAADISLVQDVAVGTTIDGLGSMIDVTVTATDQSGNTDQCVISVVLLDTIRPVLTCVPDTILGADAGCSAVLPDYRSVASATDNCNDPSEITFLQTPAAGSVYSDEATSIDVTIRATDATGNFTECVFTVLLVDTIAPTVVCPQDQVVEVDANCEIVLADYRDQATPDDNCSDDAAGEIALEQRPAPGTVFSGEATIVPVTIIATDQSGNVDSCLFTVELNDVTPPSIPVCQNDTIGVLTAACDYTLPDYWNIGPATAQDNCRPTGTTSTTATGDQITYTQTPPPGTVLMDAFTVTTITLTADDGNGNTVSCDFELTLTDTISPTITCPTDTIANPDAGCDFALEDYTGRAVVNDNCTAGADLVVTQSPVAGTVISGQAFSQDITLTVTDASGNTQSCTFNLMLQDTISPSIDCPADKVENLTAGCEFTVPDYTGEAVTDDNCTEPDAIVVTQSPVAGTVITDQNEGDAFVVTLTADDGNGNTTSCDFTVTLDDVIPPVITCPADSTIFVDASCEAPLPDLVAVTTATDNCADATGGSGITITQAPLATTVYSSDDTEIVVTLTADDNNGNTAECQVTVTLQDTISPMITCPANEVLLTDGNCEVMVPDYRPQAVTSDNCTLNGNIVVTQDIAPGTVFSGEGTSQVITLTADDGNGNTTSCTLEISVDDNVPPTIVCPPTQTQFTDAACMVTIDDYTSLAVTDDNCTDMAAIVVTQSPAPGTVFTGVQNVTVTLTADDGNGNTTTCDFVFFVRDNTAPMVTCPATQQETADANCVATIGDYTALASATDNCSTLGDPNGNGITLVQTPPAGTTITGFDQSITVTITATDSSGNFSSCDFMVELVDEVNPTIVCPPAQTLFADADCNTALIDYRDLAVGMDNCDNATTDLVYVQSPAEGLPLNGDETMQEVTIMVTDRSGNSAECMFTVTVQDTVSPTIVCPLKDTLSVDQTCPVPLPDYTDQATVADNCTTAGGLTVSQVPAPGTEFAGDGTIIDVTLTVDDGNGNTTSCTFEVELEDQTEPVITCPGRQVLMTDGNCEAVVPDYTGLANVDTQCDNASAITLTQDPPANTLTISGDSTIQTVTITATDDAMPPNIVSCTFEVILVDDTPPAITVCPPAETVFVDADCEVMLPDFRPNLEGVDNCEAFADMVVTQSPAPGTVFIGDDTEVSVTYTLDDTNGNTVTCMATVTLQDTISPMITCPTDQVIFTDGSCEAALPDYTDAMVSDNCTNMAGLVTTQVNPPGTTLSGFNDMELVTLTVDDGNGNTTSCSFTVTLDDDDNPEIICPPSQDIAFGEDCGFTIPDFRPDALLDDNCAVNLLTVAQTPSPDSVLMNLGTAQEVVLTVTDASGNSARCAFTVTTTSPTPPPAQASVMLAVVNRPTGTGTVNLLDAFDNMALSNLSNIDLDAALDPGVGPYLVTFYLNLEDAAAEVRAIPAEDFDPAISGEVVIARIEDPATGCFVQSQILIKPRTPGVSEAEDAVQCNRPGTVVTIDGRPVPGGEGTTIVRHQWRILSSGTTRIQATNLSNIDQQVLTVNTSGLRSGTVIFEYQFFEDYGDGPVVPSVPRQIALELQNVGGGDFFWDGN